MSSKLGKRLVSYGENAFFFKKDILGNVIELLDSTGATVVKYSRAFKIGMGEFWSQGIGKFGTEKEIFNLAWDVYNFARSVFDDPNESNWILY